MLVYKSLQVYEAGKLEDKRNGGLSEATKTADVFSRCLDRVKKSRNKRQCRGSITKTRQQKNYMGPEKGAEKILRLCL